MQDMFSHLDPEVVYILLSECDFKVEHAMDSLLELSVAAEDIAPISGFEVAAALLSSQRQPVNTESPRDHPTLCSPQQPPSVWSHADQDESACLTEEIDHLIRQELETLTPEWEQGGGRHTSDVLLPDTKALSSTSTPSSRNGTSGDQPCPGTVHPAGQEYKPHSPVSDQSFIFSSQQDRSVLDFSHLTSDPAELDTNLGLGATGGYSASQAYNLLGSPTCPPSGGMPWGARIKSSISGKGGEEERLNVPRWNMDAPEFHPQPRIHGNYAVGGPVFITPVNTPLSWAARASPAGGACLSPAAGSSGFGQSTLAKAILQQNPHGVVFSTDDYFCRHGDYCYDPSVLGEAHEWNHNRAKEAMEASSSPVIIDNTNMQGWEMRPYVAMALKMNYKVLFREPDSWWKNKPKELERRTRHGVSADKIRRMIDHYERHVTIQSIMGSTNPKLESKHCLEPPSEPECQPSPQTELQPPSEPERQPSPQTELQPPSEPERQPSPQTELQPPSEAERQPSPQTELQPPSEPEFKSSPPPELHPPTDPELQPLPQSEQPDNIESQHTSSDPAHPDLVEEQLLIQNFIRPRPQLFSSLPDVSSVGCFRGDLVLGHTSVSTESLLSFSERPSEKSLVILDIWDSQVSRNGGVLDSERNSQLEERQQVGDVGVAAGTPSCSAEPVLFNASCRGEDERPTAFSESIGQRVKRERRSRTKKSDCLEPADIVKDTGQSEREVGGIGRAGARPELLDFVGDWPSEEVLEQRGKASRRRVGREVGCGSEEAGQSVGQSEWGTGSGPNFTEFQKLLDLLQTGVAPSNSSVSDHAPGGGLGRGEAACLTSCGDGASDYVSADPSLGQELPHNVMVESTPTTEHREGETILATGEGGQMGAVEMEGMVSLEAGIGSHISEVGQGTDASETSVESEVGHVGGGSRKQQCRSRRALKHCKLALTFTHNSPQLPSAPDPKLDPKSPSPPPSLVDTGRSTQTDPQDFAFLWRLERDRHGYPNDAKNSGPTILRGNPSRFVPEVSAVVSAAIAVHPSGWREVPYRVMLEKGSQVEDDELQGGRTQQENLDTLRRHFKLVNRDILDDLYDKCQQNLEWTSNLLLDSGERLFREEEEGAVGGDEDRSMLALFGGVDQTMGTGLGCQLEPDGACSITEQEVAPSSGQELEVQAMPTSHSDINVGVASGEGGEEVGAYQGGVAVGFSALGHGVPGAFRGVGSEGGDTPLVESTRLEPRTDVTEQVGLEGGANSEEWEEWVRRQEVLGEEELSLSLPDQLKELLRRQKETRGEPRGDPRERAKRTRHVDIQSVELKLPTELALQLTELFGPVGVDPGVCSPDDYVVKMDLNMAKLLYQKWKETIQEKQRQAALSYRLQQEDELASMGSQSKLHDEMPIMDHWSVSSPHVSLRDIMTEEQALQDNMERVQSRDGGSSRRDGAAMLKETQLFDLFPNIDRHFLLDIFRDHNYCLEQTEQFLRSVLVESPVRNVVAPERPPCTHQRHAAAMSVAPPLPQYQDVEDPEYEDFRAEARLQKQKQQDCFSKAAEAYRQKRKDVASFYAQQGHLHGQKMREANHRAAVQIFERVNSSLLPQNVLDLHGLHVDEALIHLQQVLEEKITERQQSLCAPQLSVITGRGNHSHGGVARVRPAVIDYLKTQGYRYTPQHTPQNTGLQVNTSTHTLQNTQGYRYTPQHTHLKTQGYSYTPQHTPQNTGLQVYTSTHTSKHTGLQVYTSTHTSKTQGYRYTLQHTPQNTGLQVYTSTHTSKHRATGIHLNTHLKTHRATGIHLNT
ncbi:hypothetical protein UPYG_G00049780, partial [Umbra pygmaea]